MKSYAALSVAVPAGDRIRSGKKTLEIRQWSPESVPLRDLVIVQNKTRLSSNGVTEDPHGEAVAIVDVESVEEWKENEVNEACVSYWAKNLLGRATTKIEIEAEPHRRAKRLIVDSRRSVKYEIISHNRIRLHFDFRDLLRVGSIFNFSGL